MSLLAIVAQLLLSLMTLLSHCSAQVARYVEGQRVMAKLAVTSTLRASDIDRDGDLDLIGLWNTLAFVMINTDGRFLDETLARLPNIGMINYDDLVAVDVDRDGNVDIVLCAGSTRDHVFMNDGRGFFRDESASRLPSVTAFEYQVHAIDVDSDTDLDLLLLTGGPPPQTPVLWINDGRGSYRDETTLRLLSSVHGATCAVTGDIDADGDLDLICGSRFRENPAVDILLNDGRGSFSRFASMAHPDSGVTFDLALLDADSDGRADLYVGRGWLDSRDRLYRNTGGGRFQDASENLVVPSGHRGGARLCVGDFDEDGDQDLIVGLSDASGPFLLESDGKGRLVVRAGALVDRLGSGHGIAALDVDGDSDLDLVTGFQPFNPWSPSYGLYLDVNLERHVRAPPAPSIGQPWPLELWSLKAPAVFVLFVAAGRAVIPLPGIGTWQLDPAASIALGAWPLFQPGKWTLPAPIPNVSALRGLPIAAQAAVFGPAGLKVTNAAPARIQ